MSNTVVRHCCPSRAERQPTRERPVRVSARDLDAADLLEAHRHPWAQVTYALSGVMNVRALGSSWIVPPLRAIWIAADVEHEIEVLEKARLRAVFVLAERAPFAGPECRMLAVSSLLRELIVGIAATEAGTRENLMAELILDEVKSAATRPIRVPLPRDKRLSSLCDALLADPGSALTLTDWAHRVGASERTLARLFERELGLTYGQWRQQARLAHAVPMIARGMPLALVAGELGYASQSAFSAMFKKTFGSSPSAFFAGATAGK